MLKKQKADIFISFDGVCSLTAKIPQCLFINDLSFLEKNTFLKRSYANYYKRNTPKFLKKAETILTNSITLKEKIASRYQTGASKIHVIYAAASEIFQPVNDPQKTRTKGKFAEGKEYFLYSGTIHSGNNLINLLKGFSLFKKRLQSGMKLVFVRRYNEMDKSFTENLKKYKYRNDVIIIDKLDEKELPNIVASAYAMIYSPLSNDLAIPVFESMQCNTPVMASSKTFTREFADDAVIYFDGDNPDDIGEKMMLLYKDEDRRKQLIEKSRNIINEYNWNKTADILWQCIEKTVK